MSKQTQNYIDSQQHWEDRINDDYYYQKQIDKQMEKDIEKQIYNEWEKQNKMSKLTAVEILEIKLLGIVSFDSEVLRNKYKEQFKIAKEMEKEQMWEYIKKNYCIGPNSLEFHRLEFEQYYNETYKKDEK